MGNKKGRILAQVLALALMMFTARTYLPLHTATAGTVQQDCQTEETGSGQKTGKEAAVEPDVGTDYEREVLKQDDGSPDDAQEGAGGEKQQDAFGQADDDDKGDHTKSSIQTSASVASVTAGGRTYYVDTLTEAFAQQSGDVEIKLLADTTQREKIEITSGRYILDLNGKKITCLVERYTGSDSMFRVIGAALSIRDSSTGGCIVRSETTDQKVFGCIQICENGRLDFTGGSIQGFSTGVEIGLDGGSRGEAEITGNAHIQSGIYGIMVNHGKLVLSGEAWVFGKEETGINLAGTKTTCPIDMEISENPYVSSGKYALYISNNNLVSAAVSGGTFNGTAASVTTKYGLNKLFLNKILLNYGTVNTPKYAYFDSNGEPVAGIDTIEELTGTITVRECTHPGCTYGHQTGTTVHGLDKKCTACGEIGPSVCSYVWEEKDMVYTGVCSCKSTIEVTLEDDGGYVYNGSPCRPEVSVKLDEQPLDPDKYKVDYTDNVRAGTANAVISGISSGSDSYIFTCNARFGIALAALSVTGVTVCDRVYDGTGRVEIREVLLEGVIGTDDVAADTKNMSAEIDGTGAGNYDSVTLSGTGALIGADGDNYILAQLPRTLAADVTIQKSELPAKEGILKVERSQSREYTFDLRQLCPELPNGQTFGSVPAAYTLGEISLGTDWYTGGAAIDGTVLTLPLQAAGADAQGIIGTIQVIIHSENFRDIYGTIKVSTVTPGGTDSSSGSTGGGNSSGYQPLASVGKLPYLKASPQTAGWYDIRKEVEKAPEESIIEINMNGTFLVPDSMMETLQGRDVTILLDMGRMFSWSINGKEITSVSRAAGYMDMLTGTGPDIIPEKAVNAVAGGLVHMQMRFAQDGAFGFEGVLAIQTRNISWKTSGTGVTAGVQTAGYKDYTGMYANLFYYNPQAARLEFTDAQKIGADGSVCFVITHGTRYAVVLSQQPMGSI